MFSENAQSAFYPTGSIIAYFRTTVDPSGWVLCDGITRTDNSDGKYNELYNLGIGTGGNGTTSYTPPNLKGAFLRGAGQSGINSTYVGPTVKTFQDMGIMDHSHNTVGTHNHNVVQDSGCHAAVIKYSQYNMSSMDIDPTFKEPDLAGTSGPQTVLSQVNTGYDSYPDGLPLGNIINLNSSYSTTESRPFNYGVNWILKL